jgi:hypothetical protein
MNKMRKKMPNGTCSLSPSPEYGTVYLLLLPIYPVLNRIAPIIGYCEWKVMCVVARDLEEQLKKLEEETAAQYEAEEDCEVTLAPCLFLGLFPRVTTPLLFVSSLHQHLV